MHQGASFHRYQFRALNLEQVAKVEYRHEPLHERGPSSGFLHAYGRSIDVKLGIQQNPDSARSLGQNFLQIVHHAIAARRNRGNNDVRGLRHAVLDGVAEVEARGPDVLRRAFRGEELRGGGGGAGRREEQGDVGQRGQRRRLGDHAVREPEQRLARVGDGVLNRGIETRDQGRHAEMRVRIAERARDRGGGQRQRFGQGRRNGARGGCGA